MLRHRVIPLVLLDGYSVVKTIQFDVRRNLGNPITVARVYNNRNIDELILLDIDASKKGRGIDLHTVSTVADHCFMPLTVGGGLRSCQDIANALEAGADKVSLNTIIFDDIDVVKQAVEVFGSQCIVASIDVRKGEDGQYKLYSHAGREIRYTFEEVLKILMEYCKVGEILLNNVDLDGKMSGYDLDLIRYAASIVRDIPLIVAGGAASPSDCSAAIQQGASAVSAASIFHFTSITPMTCKEDMEKQGIPVRK
ncbi:MAG TPA: imidazole glycerol phosphate synthase cyclase subunit [Candidatus Omnitrophota bacterium]|nr:imidazole glycerol phosphate synthase cyclase subunit [Candidatus Omnitrophota bacterium]